MAKASDVSLTCELRSAEPELEQEQELEQMDTH
jgi:hypothetical protein